MIRCKKHRPKTTSLQNHSRNPVGDCANCVYFSSQNCGMHGFNDFMGGSPA